MAKIPLTPRVVDMLKVEAGRARTVYIDTHPDAPKGFALRVTANGAKTFVLIRTAKQLGRRPWVSIAPGQGAGLDAARRAAELRGGEISMGRDPNAEARVARAQARYETAQKRADTEAWTLRDMLEAYYRTRLPGLSKNTASRYRGHIKNDVVLRDAALARTPVRHVARGDIRDLVQRIAVRTPAQAALTLEFLRSAYRWAMDEEVLATEPDGRRVLIPRVDRDPTRGIDSEPRVKRGRFLDDREIVTFWRGMDKLPAPEAYFLRLILLNGTRREETHLTRTEDLALDVGAAETWYIPKERRKGRKRGARGERREQTVPLAPLSVRLFRELISLQKGPRVFKGVAVKCINYELREASGIADVQVHDLRRTCSTGLQGLGAPPHVISVVLGHKREKGASDADGVYMHDRRVTEHRAWLGKWAAHVEGLLATPDRQ